jgi:crotonobetainyl-CoA:carnitine CoA-transferase CaiB-like acyl-CoA transferase
MQQEICASVLRLAGLSGDAANGGGEPPVEILGDDPCLDTPFKVGAASAAALAAQGVAFQKIWRMRGGSPQRVKVDVAAAALATFGIAYQSQHGYPIALPEPDYPTVGLYPTRDERFILINGGYPHLRDGLLDLLGCADSRLALERAIARWDAAELEDATAAHGLCGVMIRSPQEWQAHPQGAAIADMPVVEIRKIGDSPPEPFGPAHRPLDGIRVLDLTHVIAGPTCAKSLAEQGATVLHITCPRRPRLLPFDVDTGHGKLSAFLDLIRPEDRSTLKTLVKTADVFSQSYRPGKIAGFGFSPEALAQMRPGIVAVSFNCYGHAGPWRTRPGFEQLAQGATGMAVVQGTADNPQLAPTYPNDYITGFLGAFGALAALIRRAEEGGSYHVRVSLCRTAMWLQSLGMVDHALLPPAAPAPDYLKQFIVDGDSAFGRLSYFGPVLQMSETPSRWDLPAAPLGAHPAVWPAQAGKTLGADSLRHTSGAAA